MRNVPILMVAVLLASGCVQPPIPAGAKIVDITPSGFSPAMLAIKEGDTVAFVNKDASAHQPASAMHPTHTVYPEGGGCIGSKFDACRPLAQGEHFDFTFTHKGEWRYHDHLNCCTNTGFFGTIVVE
ncbi:MAG: hypothetical protein HY365_02760 [Candidatus Aenigmarchaeota archaeon]|nr:hypothetical protein [Candidatus Aenigmarchaeota archaeon]